jgi:hypothetical protein
VYDVVATRECESEWSASAVGGWEEANTSTNVFGLAVDFCESRQWHLNSQGSNERKLEFFIIKKILKNNCRKLSTM